MLDLSIVRLTFYLYDTNLIDSLLKIDALPHAVFGNMRSQNLYKQ